MTYLGSFHSSSETYYPEFYGQSFSFDDVADGSDSYSACPDVLQNVRFTRIINGNIERFQTVGYAFKYGEIPIFGDGFARATYQLPDNIVYSGSGGYYAYGGSINVVCAHARFGFTSGAAFGYVDASAFGVYGYNGTIRVSGISSSGPTAGWTYHDNASGFSNGNNDGWVGALNTYLGGGGCPPYWDVMVDGKLVCKNGQAVDMT